MDENIFEALNRTGIGLGIGIQKEDVWARAGLPAPIASCRKSSIAVIADQYDFWDLLLDEIQAGIG